MSVQYTLIGTGTTDENGVAHMTHDAQGQALTNPGYKGTGAGVLDIVASSVASSQISSSILQQSTPVRVFDCSGYDGDNVPVSVDLSGTTNAVVTDAVCSLVAEVVNTNGNPCINIPVVFKQGSTVLGTAYTDCTGTATLSYTWTVSDIFTLTASYGNLSDDLTMFVKDKNQTYIKYDLGVLTNHNDIWTISDTCNLTRGNEHTFIKESSVSDWSIVRVNTLIPVNTRIEYDFKVHDGLVSNFFCALSKTLTGGYINGAGLDHFNGTFDTWYHMVIDINSSSAVFSCIMIHWNM